jgi:AAA domain
VKPQLDAAMEDTPVVVIVGPRQSGKSTLAALVAGERDARQVTLDDAGPRAAANADPTGFVEALEPPVVIDEFQKVSFGTEVPSDPIQRAQSPIKVHEATKEKVRYAALMAGLKQAELVERAVDEYVERHREDFAQRMEQAQEALLGGKSATLAHSLGVGEADVRRVGGVAPDQLGAHRPRRATSNQARPPEGQSPRASHSSASAAKIKPKSASRRRSSTKRPSAA